MASKKDNAEQEEKAPEAEPETLVGSGAPMLKVRAKAGVLGLAAGQETTMADTEEVRANVATGNLEVLD